MAEEYNVSKIDELTSNLRFYMKKRLRRVKDMEKKSELSEKAKSYIGEEYSFIRSVESLIVHVYGHLHAIDGKLPAQDQSMEEVVLGAILLESQSFLKVKDFLHVDHFYSAAHKEVYKSICELHQNGSPIDMRMVVVQMRKNGRDYVVDNLPYYIANLSNQVSGTANIKSHAYIIVENAIKRELMVVCSRMMSDAHDNTTDCFDMIDLLESRLTEIKAWRK